MALGKITIVIGAGIIGSVLSKEGGLSDATNFFSSALRIVTKHLHQDKDGSPSATKPRTDTLLAQVNNLRKELQFLASSRSVTIVTSTRTGSRAYGVTTILVVGCLGYGYVWWKGWKLSDMMFVTRRGFSDACSSVGKQFELVSSSITESKMDQIDDGQNFAGRGLYALCKLAEGWQQRMNKESIQESSSSSLRAIEPPRSLGLSRMGSVPPLSPETPSPLSQVLRPSITISAAGLKELQEVSNPIRLGNFRNSSGNASNAANSASESSTSGRFVWKIPGINALTRSWSTAN